MTAKTCKICGKPSGMYPLCINCLKLKNEGKIKKCEDCDNWYIVEKGCACHSQQESTESQSSELNCIICREPSNGKHLCKNCYYKYKNKTVFIKVVNGTKYSPTEEWYTGSYICSDGHIVKSKSERDIDNYLFHHSIPHAYEKTFSIDADPKHDIHPDFLMKLNDKEVYLEHWGIEGNNRYNETKEYKLEIYKRFGITLICTTEDDMKDVEASLLKKLTYFKPDKINFLEE